MADPPSHLHTGRLLSVTLGGPVCILVPGAGGGVSPCSAQVGWHGLPRGSDGACEAPGSEGNDWMGPQRAGRRSHGGRAPWDPGRPAHTEGGQASGAQVSPSVNTRKPQWIRSYLLNQSLENPRRGELGRPGLSRQAPTPPEEEMEAPRRCFLWPRAGWLPRLTAKFVTCCCLLLSFFFLFSLSTSVPTQHLEFRGNFTGLLLLSGPKEPLATCQMFYPLCCHHHHCCCFHHYHHHYLGATAWRPT